MNDVTQTRLKLVRSLVREASLEFSMLSPALQAEHEDLGNALRDVNSGNLKAFKPAPEPKPAPITTPIAAQSVVVLAPTGLSPDEQQEPWVNKQQIANHLKCSVRHVNKMMNRRVIPYVKCGRFVRFQVSAVDTAMSKLESRSILI